MQRRSSLLGFAVAAALAVPAFAPAFAPAQAPGSRPAARQSELLPDAELQVRPCCRPMIQHADPEWSPPARAVAVAPPEGQPYDEPRIERLRVRARVAAPDARAVEEIAPPAVPEPAPRAPGVRTRFNGLHFGQTGGFVPPDTQIAAGPGRLLQATNSAVQLSDKSGKGVLRQSAGEHFGEDDSAFLFDPKVHYDPLSERFFLLFMQLDTARRKSFILMSVSRSGNPATLGDQDWCNYRIKSKKGTSWADYPGLGMNESWVAISTNNFKFSNDSFKQSVFWVMDKAQLVDNAASCPAIAVSRIPTRRDNQGSRVFTPQVAQHQEPSGVAGSPLFAVNTQFKGFSDQYVLWRIGAQAGRDGARAKPKATRAQVTGSGYAFPPEASQKGSDKGVDAGDVRVMQQLVFIDGQLWVVHTSGCVFEDDGEVFSCVRVARIEPDDTGAVVTFEDLFGVDQHFLFWPGIGVASGGDVVAAFQISGAKQHLGMAYNGLRQGTAAFGPVMRLADDFDNIRVVAKGKCATEKPASNVLVRTGDYVGVSPDPDSGDVWISGELAARVQGSCAWKTKIVRVGY